MKIGIYNPYLNIFGGGEKYIFDLADFFIKRGDRVDLFWDDSSIKGDIFNRYSLDLASLNFLPRRLLEKKDIFKRLTITKNYQVFIYVTDGSLFTSLAKENILIIQSPAHIPTGSPLNKLKINSWETILCYSEFVGNYIKKVWKKNIFVLPPAINVNVFKPLKKENLILSVGRFTQSLHTKKQEILIEAFKRLTKINRQIKLVLVGGIDSKDFNYLKKIEELTKGYKIELYPNLEFRKLKDFYGRAKIYWHAAGFGEDLINHPEKAEHFGITTIEAMASGCIPIVFKGGGQIEIIDDKVNGYFWENEDQLIDLSIEALKNYDKYKFIAVNAIKRSNFFSKQNFENRLKEILCL